jgi:hypothetical protein
MRTGLHATRLRISMTSTLSPVWAKSHWCVEMYDIDLTLQDRLACALGGEAVLMFTLQAIGAMATRPEWQARYAVLIAVCVIAEGQSHFSLRAAYVNVHANFRCGLTKQAARSKCGHCFHPLSPPSCRSPATRFVSFQGCFLYECTQNPHPTPLIGPLTPSLK